MMRVCLIGLGEVGTILADDLAARGATVSAWDIQFSDSASKPSATARARKLRVASSSPNAAESADLILSAVTAAQTVEAARATSPGMYRSALYVDLNSASPGAKQEAADIVNATGAAYVEASVMSPFPPKRSASPILLGGPHAEHAIGMLQALGFSGAKVFSKEYGKASAAKLCRSVMIKGIEALLCESLVSARTYGVESTVIASLSDLFPGVDWNAQSRYMITRAIEHGARRAEEMREAARTVGEAGVEPLLSQAIAARQDWATQFAAALDKQDLGAMLDAIRAEMRP